MESQRMLQTGEPAPWFVARSTSNERYHFDTVAGRYVVLCFLQSAGDPYSRSVLDGFLEQRRHFDDDFACFFAITCDPADEAQRRVQQILPGYRVFWDFDQQISKRYGVRPDNADYRPCTVVLDKRLRVLAVVSFNPKTTPQQHVSEGMATLSEQPALSAESAGAQAPILVVPRVFEPAFCRQLIDYYKRGEARESGFMRERDGKTVGVFDNEFKRRRDCGVDDADLRLACRERLVNRLKPEVHKAFQFVATYAERYIVACYNSSEGGFFKPHRDNTTKGTAHRRFAVTINLNTGEYEGGRLRFPEFGRQTYEAPLGGAVVFSCSLLHEATPVTAGERYAFLPFLYDDAAAKLREANMPFIEVNR